MPPICAATSSSTLVPIDLNRFLEQMWTKIGLEASANVELTLPQLKAIMPDAGKAAATFLAPLNAAMKAHGIDTPEQRAAFLGQIAVESNQLRAVKENLNYSAKRMTEVWPKRFKTEADAEPYAKNPEKLANKVYSGRLGNGDAASGDGYKYRGRGLMQTTGRENYRKAGFEHNPEALENPSIAADSAGKFWKQNGLNERSTKVLKRAEYDGITQTVNGGQHGAGARWVAYQRGIKALTPPKPKVAAVAPGIPSFVPGVPGAAPGIPGVPARPAMSVARP
jgi:predicted chitinase